MRSGHPRAAVERHARRLLASLDPDVREGLGVDPITVIRARLEVSVQLRPERSGTGDCPIDGSYFPDPPRISVAESLSRRRVNFSVLHELGHHLQASDTVLADILWREQDGGTGLEEDICDTFAAEVLLPQHLVDEIIDDAGPTAAAVADLFTTTQASREACCVRASHRVRGPGYVVLANPDGTIRFAAPANQRYRIAPGTRQGRAHLLARAGRVGQARGESPLAYRHGTRTPAYQADAVYRDGYVFAVFVAGRPSWRQTLEASKSEALIAVDAYNRPRQCRSVEAFFVHMHLAWQLLLHACFRRQGVDYRYRKPGSRRFLRVNGEPKTWELARCVAHHWRDANNPVRRNLELTVALRNKIEHRYIEGIDVASAGYAQASLLNYEHELTSTFGDAHSLADSLRVPLFIGTFTAQGAERLRKAKRSLPMDVRHLLAAAEDDVDTGVLEDLRYEFRVHLVPMTGPKTEADLSLTFVREEDLTDEERTVLTTLGRAGTVILRERQRAVANHGLMRPKAAVVAVQQQIPYRFTMGSFVRAWKTLKVRPETGSAHPERTDERYCVYDPGTRGLRLHRSLRPQTRP